MAGNEPAAPNCLPPTIWIDDATTSPANIGVVLSLNSFAIPVGGGAPVRVPAFSALLSVELARELGRLLTEATRAISTLQADDTNPQ